MTYCFVRQHIDLANFEHVIKVCTYICRQRIFTFHPKQLFSYIYVYMHVYRCQSLDTLTFKKPGKLDNQKRDYLNNRKIMICISYKMNIWWQFSLANRSFRSDWRILYWRTLLFSGI